MASPPTTPVDNAGHQSRPAALLGLLRTRSKSRSHKRGISTPEPPSPNPALFSSSARGRRGGQSIGGDAGWTIIQGPISPPSSTNGFGETRPTQRIRLVPHLDTRRAYTFGAIVRNLRAGGAPVVMGRLEGQPAGTDNANGTTTTGKIAFKSKVVSRAHAELWMDNGGSVLVRDTKSASGTFLNRSRLSQVDTESKWFPLADGDILQLGVDYQGGLEDAYKAVKIRVEIGREAETVFDASALRALNALAKSESQPTTERIIPDCCICLSGISVRQALFTTPCCHTFHFKCIRPLIDAVPKTPLLTCPVCRTESNLDEEVEDHAHEDRVVPNLPPTPNVVEEEDRGRPISRVLPSPESPVGKNWQRQIVHPPEAAASAPIPIAHASAPSIPIRPVMRTHSIGRTRQPPEKRLLSRAPSASRALPSSPASHRPPRTTHADMLPVGAAVPTIHAPQLPPSPPPQTAPPLPPSPNPALGGNWLREMELMQRHSQYIVSKPETKTSKDKEKEREKEKADEMGRSTSLRRKGTWTRLLRAQNASPADGNL